MRTRSVPADGGVDDVVEQLRRMLDAGQQESALGQVKTLLESVLRENRQQRLQIQELLKRVYGRSSERIDPNQLRLAIEDLRADAAADEAPADLNALAPSEPPTSQRARTTKERRRNGRRKLPKDLPREVVRLVPTAEQVADKGAMSKVGEESSEVLEYVAGHFKVIEYVRETWSNATGEIVTAPAPMKIIDKGLPGPGLLTHVTLSKYKDHCPLARQSRIFERVGVYVHRNTLVDWIAAVAFLLEPLARRIYELAMLAHVLQVDDTRLDVQDRTKAKNIKRGHLWVLVGDHEYIAFRYTEDWTAEKAKKFLGQRIGWMQVDGYGGYGPVVEAGLALLVGCWMHCRRYFVKAFDAKHLRAAAPLAIIQKMYDVEAEAKEEGDDHQRRYERRQRATVPLMDELEQWLDEHRDQVEPKSLLGKAITVSVQPTAS